MLVSTVGPFVRWGEPAVQAAIGAGAHYLDSTGEGSFIREVFERFGPGAQARRLGLLTAIGYDWVPGNLAGALALRDAGEAATSVEIGYFNPGTGAGVDERRHARERGRRDALARLRLARRAPGRTSARRATAARSRSSPASRRARSASRSSEHFALPRVHPTLRDVDVFLGWFGPASRADARHLGRDVGADEGPRRRPAPWTRCSAGWSRARPAAPTPPRARRARSVVLAEACDAGGTVLADGALGGHQRLRPDGALPGLGRRDRRRAGACRAPARWGRWTASASTRCEAGCAEAGMRAGSVGLPLRSTARRLRRCAALTAASREGSERRSGRGWRPLARVGARIVRWRASVELLRLRLSKSTLEPDGASRRPRAARQAHSPASMRP